MVQYDSYCMALLGSSNSYENYEEFKISSFEQFYMAHDIIIFHLESNNLALFLEIGFKGLHKLLIFQRKY